MSKINLAWIHLKNLNFFLSLGATNEEQKIGQNVTMNLSLCIPYTNTNDDLKNTVDYGAVYEMLAQKIQQLKNVNLLEYLAEQLLSEIQANFENVHAAKITIQKGYVPLKHFSGTASIEVYKQFSTN